MINRKIKNNLNPTRKIISGFTLVEAMVAVLVLSSAITTLMYVVSDSLFAARYSRYQITATYLAQEASDFIRNDRDTFFLMDQDDSWRSFIRRYSLCLEEDGCYFEVLQELVYYSEEIQTCVDSSTGTPIKCPFFNDNQEGEEDQPLYSYNHGDQESKFQREIKMVEGTNQNQDEVILTVTVLWKEKTISKETVLETILTKWQ